MEPDPHAAQDEAASERSLTDDVRLLIEEGKAYAASEIAWQKARAARAGKGIKGALGCGALALALVFLSLLALILGLILALTPLLSPLGAMAAVALGLLLLAGLSTFAALLAWKRMTRDIGNTGGDAHG